MISLVAGALLVVRALLLPALIDVPPQAEDSGASSALVQLAQATAEQGPRDKAEWLQLLMAELQRRKKYPVGSARRNEGGVAKVQFRVDRNGRLLEHSLVASSGFIQLDKEALALVERAKIPPFPSSMTESELSFTVPVNFDAGEAESLVDHNDQFRLSMYTFAALSASVLLTVIGIMAWWIRRRAPALAQGELPGDISIRVEGTTASRRYRSNSLFARHWRGELPLWASYWIVSLCVNLFAAVISALAIAISRSEQGYHPSAIFTLIVTIWICVLGVSVWQFVGVWRSADRYAAARAAENRTVVWARLAQVVVGLSALSLVVTFVRQGPVEIAETFRIAFRGDPEIPPYSITVSRNGTEAEIIGGFKYSLTDDLAKILDANRGIRTVHLDSLGGRVGEGERLFQLIRKRGLDTYVSSQCFSACTLAFAGGRRRYLSEGAKLGFHRSAFAGVSVERFYEIQDQVFWAAGFDRKFIATALSTPSEDIWIPSIEALVEAGVVTGTRNEVRASDGNSPK